MTSDSYQLRFEERDEYLFAEVSADTVDVTMAHGYLREMVARCRELGRTKLMFVRNIPLMLPAGSLYFMTQDFADAFGGIRVAFVNPYTYIDKEMRFAILMGQNAGANFRVFEGASEAEKWLING